MSEISNLTNCTLAEIESLGTYLSRTEVRWLVQVIEGGAGVSKGKITPLSEIGRLRTMWGNLGGIKSINEHGSGKFLVCQVIQALRNPLCTDSELLSRIEKYKQSFANGLLKLTITLLKDQFNITICDGNKSAIACFQHGLETGQSNLSLPVYLVSSNTYILLDD